jgi:predicted heme/steroid binding protein
MASPAPSAQSVPTTFTAEKLHEYTGQDGGPIYLAFEGTVFDVTPARELYGPGGRLADWAGRDVTSRVVHQGVEDGSRPISLEYGNADIEALATEQGGWLALTRETYHIKVRCSPATCMSTNLTTEVFCDRLPSR